jgi:hypothetical protein
VLRRCELLGVRSLLFGGRVLDGIAAEPLSGDPERAADDLVALGDRLGRSLTA